MRHNLSHEWLKTILDYDPLTGVFVWRYRPDYSRSWNTRYAGKVAGAERKRMLNTGLEIRWTITFDKVKYFQHRLAWFYVTGEWPKKEIDHINGDPSDNRWENLRECTHSQNRANARKTYHKTGYKGVHYRPELRLNPFQAAIRVNNQLIHLGYFPTAEEASAIYLAAAKKHFGEFAHSGAQQ